MATLVACLVLACVAPAQARDAQPRPWQSASDSGSTAGDMIAGDRSAFSAALEDPPSEAEGLPAAQENIELVGELKPKFNGSDVRIGEIADLTVHKGHAYLNSWDAEQCDRGGVYVMDIRNPATPKQVAYIPPKFPFYHGEGAHAISMSTPAFTGDLLAVNDEAWGSNVANNCDIGTATTSDGGFDLYDVSDPAKPKVLVQGAGDRDGGDGPLGEQETALGNSYHSVFVWQAGPRAYLVASDNVELEDVDIFDITDPKAPVQIADIELADRFPQILDNGIANGAAIFNHDMFVKRVDGRYLMNVSNWDSGYVTIDVTDPANPTLVADTGAGNDPFRPALNEEGNSHQSDFSADNQFLLAADEDFAPFRSVLTGPVRSRTAVEGGDNPKRIANLPDQKLNGQTVWAGNGCEGSAFNSDDPADPEFPAAPPADADPNTDRIALVERGGPTITGSGGTACGFAEKIDNAAAAGFDGVVIYNQVRPDDGQINMNTTGVIGPAVPATIPAVQMRRVDAIGPQGAIADAPGAFGTAGPSVSVGIVFDGWGDTHLYDAKTGALIDSYAVPESQDPRFAEGFGDLSVHEFASDPTEPVAYSAYYGAGMRTFRFSRADGLVPTGKWIDDDGNGSNFWGVEVFNSGGERLFAGSDRDFGLQIFRYTGARAAKAPTCSDVEVSTRNGKAVEVPLTCKDANGNELTRRIVSAPGAGTVSAISGDKVTYTPTGSFAGTDSFTFAASDGSLESAPAKATITVAQGKPYYYVSRKRPGLTGKVTPRRDKKKPFAFRVSGRLKRPNGVSKAAGCKGKVTIVAKKGSKTLAKRTTTIKQSSCGYAARVKLGKKAGRKGTAKFRITFKGNNALFGKAITRTAKYGSAKKGKGRRN